MENGKLLIYTRKPVEGSYSSYLAYSVHLAYSNDGSKFKALNQNYGILFAAATIDENDVIRAKGIKKPYLFRTDGGGFGITAVRINADGSNDEEGKGQVLFWTSDDLIHFNERGLIDLEKDSYVEEIMRKCDAEMEEYGIKWPESVPEGAVMGNIIDVDKALIEKLKIEWSPLENVAVEVPDLLTVSSKDELNIVKATAVYSDGSRAEKKVDWHLEEIDFSEAGTYEITGTVRQEKYDFPLAVGYADPVITKWQGKYYFLATNDNVNDIGIFVRKADNVADLFVEGVKEYLILNRNEARGLVQTFWAPEFHIINGQMYIFFAVSGKQWGPQCHIMKLKKGGDIIDSDSWTDPIRVVKKDGSNLTDKGITLDMTYFEVNKTSYVIWSYRYRIGQPDDTGSMLYIATVDPAKPWQLTSEPVLLSRPLYGWENIEGTINNEGPYPLITDDYVYISYSGGDAIGYTYALGLLSIKKDGDLLDPDKWEKSPTSVLSYYSVNGEYGPGHNAFYSNDNGDIMITYHAEPIMENHKRSTGIRRVHFDINKRPRFDMSIERDLRNEFKEIKMKIIVSIA